MYKRLPFCDNVNVWSMVKIKYLPEEIQKDIEIVVFEELKLKLANLTGSIANFSYKDIKYIVSDEPLNKYIYYCSSWNFHVIIITLPST